MKRYKPRPGIVRTKICGVHVLIPSREAFSACTTIQRLPLMWVAAWDDLENGRPIEHTIEVQQLLTKKSEEEIVARIEAFWEGLAARGFLIEVPEDAAPAEEARSEEPPAPEGPAS